RAVETASRHGVVAMRVQCHVDPQVRLDHLDALLAVREQYHHRMKIQIVTFPQQGLCRHPGTLDIFREAFDRGADVMGCASNLDRGVPFREHIDVAFELAVELGVDLDAHADLGIPWEIGLEDLEIVHLAHRTMEYGYHGRVTAAHVCALDSLNPQDAARAIQAVRAAGMHIVSQPDLYRLGRNDQRHVRRGLTRVKELLAAGVNVAYASNNVQDALRPMGNFDLLEEGMILAYGAHMDTIEQLETLLRMSTTNAAKILGLKDFEVEVGNEANLVILDAPSPSAAIVHQAEKLYVIRAGRIVAANTRASQLF
ncbi:MAG: amidohydrolase family protein, partial [Chloroflexota bacterium]